MAKRWPRWAEVLGQVVKWVAVAAAGLLLLVGLYLLVVLGGAALHLWPISAR